MNRLFLHPTILIFLPAIALIPVSYTVIKDTHGGGVGILSSFFYAAFHPSYDNLVLNHSFYALQITVASALLGWIISLFIGFILGILSSQLFWFLLGFAKVNSNFIKGILAIPRAVHEIVWGLLLLQLFGLSPLVAILAIVIPYSCLVAKVVSDQIDNYKFDVLLASKYSGAGIFSILITVLFPSLIPLLRGYGSYRLECALRSATLLGIFGLGGIGTELQLTFQSLQFSEMWTSLWMLGLVMFSLEKLVNWVRSYPSINSRVQYQFIIFPIFFIILFLIAIFWLSFLGINLFDEFNYHPIDWPTITQILIAFKQLPVLNLILSTLLITFLAAGIAIGIPPLGLLLIPTKFGMQLQSFLWLFCRLIPVPLFALLLLVCVNPSSCLAALALGLHNIGIMGRLLKEGFIEQNKDCFQSMKNSGACFRSSLLYGILCPQTKSYLSYAAYRTDVLLRETALLGVVGGVGLGWQLQESLSSFAWAQVVIITSTYISLTLVGEYLIQIIRRYCLGEDSQISLEISY